MYELALGRITNDEKVVILGILNGKGERDADDSGTDRPAVLPVRLDGGHRGSEVQGRNGGPAVPGTHVEEAEGNEQETASEKPRRQVG